MLAVMLCGWIAVAGGICSCRPGSSGAGDRGGLEADTAAVAGSPAYFFDMNVDSLDVAGYTVRRGDNLSLILSRLQLPHGREAVLKAVRPFLDPGKLYEGLTYHVLTSRDSAETAVCLIFARSRTDHVVIDLTGDSVQVRPLKKEIAERRRYIEGSVKTSLWNEIRRQGADPGLAIQLADLFAWQIDFFELQPQDSFRALYVESFMDDTVSLKLTVTGAVFTHSGQVFSAIPFTQDSVSEFFDAAGQSLRRSFLKAPLDFFRITSHFTNSRFHPVLKYYRAHHGVDYAAPTGTPVRTIGDGRVVGKGFQAGGGGNFVKIQHNAVYATSYMHLHGFAAGLSVGKHVRQGEVIGYVGSTGLSTGPHLDFRVYKNGTPVNPLKMESPPACPVRPELLDSFDRVRERQRRTFMKYQLRNALSSGLQDF
jgi:murein DD-endopeptidase MepM/ murein hydrolase activator NlpD